MDHYQLIIWDMYGTIVGTGGNTTPRKGLLDFIEKYKSTKMVLSTDECDIKKVKENLEGIGIDDVISKIYTGDDMILYRVNNINLCRGKDLIMITKDFDIPLEKAIFISDGDNDLSTALICGMDFVHVPYYYRVDEEFSSFDRIDLSHPLPKERMQERFKKNIVMCNDIGYLDLREINIPY